MTKLTVGEVAPEFNLETLEGSLSLAGLVKNADKGVIVYFYPKAGSPGCTAEACDFRDNLNSLKSAGYSVIGISPDTIADLKEFAEEESLNFVLGSDPKHQVMDQWGTWGEKDLHGKKVVGVIRSTFVVDKNGKISLIQYNVEATGHVARLRRSLGVDQ